MHQVVDLLQLAHPNDLERRIDEPPAEKINGLAGIFAVADVGPLDRLDSNDCLEDWRAEVRAGWQADCDDGPARAKVFGGLLEGFLVDSDEDDCVGPEAILGGGLDVLDHV